MTAFAHGTAEEEKVPGLRSAKPSFPLPPFLQLSWAAQQFWIWPAVLAERGRRKSMLGPEAFWVAAAEHFISNEVSLFLLRRHFTQSLTSGNTRRTLPSLKLPDASDHILTNPAMASPPVCEITWQITLVNLAFNLMTSSTGRVSFWSWGAAADLCCSRGRSPPASLRPRVPTHPAMGHPLYIPSAQPPVRHRQTEYSHTPREETAGILVCSQTGEESREGRRTLSSEGLPRGFPERCANHQRQLCRYFQIEKLKKERIIFAGKKVCWVSYGTWKKPTNN